MTKRKYLLDRERRFRSVRIPLQVFYCCAICLERMGVTITKKEILKEEGDDFDGVIQGIQTSSAGQTVIRIKIHGWRDYEWHAGFWPSALTTDITTETFEVSENNEELPDTPAAKALKEEFNFNIGRYYLWGTSG